MKTMEPNQRLQTMRLKLPMNSIAQDPACLTRGVRQKMTNMIDAETLLKEDAERRERIDSRRKLLEQLRRSTARKRWIALPCFLAAAFFFWCLCREFFSSEPMLKSDVFSLLYHSIMFGWLLYLGTSAMHVNRRDLFIIELLEKNKNENRA